MVIYCVDLTCHRFTRVVIVLFIALLVWVLRVFACLCMGVGLGVLVFDGSLPVCCSTWLGL